VPQPLGAHVKVVRGRRHAQRLPARVRGRDRQPQVLLLVLQGESGREGSLWGGGGRIRRGT
jgi:hypothetical protein